MHPCVRAVIERFSLGDIDKSRTLSSAQFIKVFRTLLPWVWASGAGGYRTKDFSPPGARPLGAVFLCIE
jgi:hypothetical protein